MRNCEECIYQIKGSYSKFECEETTIEQFEQKIRDKVIVEIIKQVIFEEELMYELGKDKGFNYSILDVNMVFKDIKEKLRQLKGEKNE